MASRSNTPANPTLLGTTDDAARGGLFVRSNIANPVSGADINGTIINDSTITLSITINGDTQTQTFTTNQNVDSTESFDFTVAGGGGMTVDGAVSGGSFDAATGILTLTRTGSQPEITIPGFAFRTDSEITALANTAIDTSTTIVKSVNGQTPTDATGAVTITAALTTDAFENSNTVTFRAGTNTATDISADALFRFSNDVNQPGPGAGTFNSLSVAPSTGFQLVQVGTGVLLQPIPSGPVGPSAMESIMVPAPATVFTAPTPPTGTVTAGANTMIVRWNCY